MNCEKNNFSNSRLILLKHCAHITNLRFRVTGDISYLFPIVPWLRGVISTTVTSMRLVDTRWSFSSGEAESEKRFLATSEVSSQQDCDGKTLGAHELQHSLSNTINASQVSSIETAGSDDAFL